MVLLWTNNAPTTQFGAQTVQIDASGCDLLLIRCKHTRTVDAYVDFLFLADGNTYCLDYVVYGSTGVAPVQRDATCGKTSVVFADAILLNRSEANNGYLIPVNIYGIKA